MTIRFEKGDIFSQSAEALVNTVNCVGVMGKGVAFEFKKRWPENFKAYKKICDAGSLSPGQMFVFQIGDLFTADDPRFIVNFPTKAHWRSKSKLSYIEDGLDALVKAIEDFGIRTIALPPLGCGNGGLDWADVRPLIESRLSDLDDVEVIAFLPRDVVDEPEHVRSIAMTYERAVLLKCLGDMERYFGGSYDRISMQKIAYLLQAFGVNFKLEFSRNLYGPYSERLKRAFLYLEKHGMISGFLSEDRQSHVSPSGYAVATEFIQNSNHENDDTIDKLGKLIQGYESPYGLELLSSVHWLNSHEGYFSIGDIVNEMKEWNENKRNSFSEETIKHAYQRLEDDGLLMTN